LPAPKRYITIHDADGISRLSTTHPTSLNAQTDPTGNVRYTTAYTTPTPLTLQSDADLDSYTQSLTQPIHGLFYPETGTVLKHIDLAPGLIIGMHRTATLDYICVLDGEIELELDGGEKRVVGKGDVVVQRGTMHRWRNLSRTEWARFLAVM
ncbi:hypothetical protein K490DRAFT_23256, partial [Saccharata proteae CBS 121410]